MPRGGSAGGISPAPVQHGSSKTQAPAQAQDETIAGRKKNVERLGNEISRAAACEAVATHRLLSAIRAFDACEGWLEYGCRSAADWLSWRIGMSPSIARDRVRVARALGALPAVDEALRTARISYSKVRAITRIATPENETELLATASAATAAELERLCRQFRGIALAQIEGRQHQARVEKRWVSLREGEDGMCLLVAQLSVEEGAAVKLALRKALSQARTGAPPAEPAAEAVREDGAPYSAEEPGTEPASADGPPPQHPFFPRRVAVGPETAEELSTFNRADALVAIFEAFLERPELASGRSPRFEVFVQVQRPALEGGSEEPAFLEDGTAIGPETARRLSCDAAIVSVETDEAGNPLDIGRRTRAIPPALQRALRLRDRSCRFPGCGQEVALKGHHVRHWARGGATRLDNLIQLCGTHHWWVHEGGCDVRSEDGVFVFYDRHGRRMENAPPLREDGCPEEELLAWLEAHGPGSGISLPIPIRSGLQRDWSVAMDALALRTYGRDVMWGLTPALPRMPPIHPPPYRIADSGP